MASPKSGKAELFFGRERDRARTTLHAAPDDQSFFTACGYEPE